MGLWAVLLMGVGPVISAEQITLHWMSTALSEAQYVPIWKEMVAEFEKTHPNIKIEPIMVARADLWPKFVTAAKARQAPDIVGVVIPSAASNGYLLSLQELWDAEPDSYKAAWPEGGLAAVKYDGKLYGMPHYAGIYAEVYNKRMLVKAGLNPDKLPATWSEYLEWCKKLTGTDHWATTVLAGPTDTTTRVLLSWIYSNGGRAFNDDLTEATFAKNPKALEAIKFYLDLASRHKVTAPGPATLNYNEQTILFAQEKIATMRNAYWGLAKVLGDNPSLKDDILVGMPPVNSDNFMAVATVTPVNISANTKHPKEAWEFVKFMLEPRWAVQMVQKANWMPLRSDLMDIPEIKNDPIVQTYLAIGEKVLTVPLPVSAWTQIASIDVVKAVQKALQNPDKVEEIFKELDVLVTERLNEE
jgi:multiple sugar transport system substrate-binding protein